MRIVMVTNNYSPHVGGVARSVAAGADYYHQQGHAVLIVTPNNLKGREQAPYDVLRVPSVPFNASYDLAAPLPVPGFVASAVKQFAPDIIHSHHPFLLGDTALRLAATRQVPIVFTHHTLYEHYTHYMPADRPAFKLFVMDLSTGYANLCSHVFAPSASLAALLRERGVTSPITVVPTGIDTAHFAAGAGDGLRQRLGIPAAAFVIGHVGRLAAEKNLEPLAEAVAASLAALPAAHALIVGDGPAAASVQQLFADYAVADRVHFTGILTGRALADAYAAMTVFAFTSQSETQGLVLAEAMAAGVPVAAFDAPGARDIVRSGENGWLASMPSAAALAFVLRDAASLPPVVWRRLRTAAQQTAHQYDVAVCGQRALDVYAALQADSERTGISSAAIHDSAWEETRRLMTAEWELWQMRLHATKSAWAGAQQSSPAAIPPPAR